MFKNGVHVIYKDSVSLYEGTIFKNDNKEYPYKILTDDGMVSVCIYIKNLKYIKGSSKLISNE